MAKVKLQRPPYAYMRGKVCDWDDAVLHIGSEAVLRSTSVYEGIKGYWQPSGEFSIVALRRHWDRMVRSARLLHIPVPIGYEDFERACFELTEALVSPDRDMWIRANLFAVEGHWGLDTVTDLALIGFHQERKDPEPVTIGVSTWMRAPDLALPARVKTSTNYQVGRLARIEGRERGYSEMVLMNKDGRVAEATGCCLLITREGRVFTPPATEGALESITLDFAEAICADLGIPFARRPVDRTELLIADEIALVGTLAEITQVTAVDGTPLPRADGLLTAVERTYLEAVRGGDPRPYVDLTPVTGVGSLAVS